MAIAHKVLVGEAMLGFVFGRLEVRYRASPKPQRLSIEAKYDESRERQGRMDSLVESVNRLGLGGGAEFSPDVGKAKPLSGTFGYTLKQPLKRSKLLSAKLQVAGVSPKWLRFVVEHLRVGCLEMKITGELPMDDEVAPSGLPLSCTEADIQRWVPSGEGWANRGLWEPLDYEVKGALKGKSASLRIEFEGPLDPKTCEKKGGLDWRMTALGGEAGELLSADQTRAGSVTFLPKFSRGPSELKVKWSRFDVSQEPATALMLNAVTRIHQSVQRVARVTLDH